ncbi:MAG: formyltetrahydrofolate deformylase [Nitrospiria bacterium]
MTGDTKKCLTETTESAVLMISCSDRQGLIASVSTFIHERNGNVIGLEQYVDPAGNHFFMRVEWALDGFSIPINDFGEAFDAAIGKRFNMVWELYPSSEKQRMAVFVSKGSHCLYDILSRFQAGEWQVDIPLIISNHPDLESAAKNLGIDFYCFPITKENKQIQEEKHLALLKKYRIDFIVLARYMQILSGRFVSQYPYRVINIHHSFLPAFPGGRPYHSAHDRGVKIIGATSHYVTAELDAGPIIAQDVVRVSHTDKVEDFVRKGRDLEKVVLSRAIWGHLNKKILVFRNRTIVFV